MSATALTWASWLRERPATVVAGVLSLLVAGHTLLTPTNLLVGLSTWGLFFGVAYFLDAYGVVSSDAEWGPLADAYSRAEQALGTVLVAVVVLGVLDWTEFGESARIAGTVGASTLALVLTIVCWRRRSRPSEGRRTSRTVR